ncbi:MAG: ATP-binding protein [Acidobacteriota bacterium]
MHNDSERVLILAPTLRDTDVTVKLLAGAGLQGEPCANMTALVEALIQGAGAIVLTEAALHEPAVPRLLEVLRAQPTWSDIPIVMLAKDRAPHPELSATLEALGNLTLLDRPVSPRSMLSAVRAALMARRRQYQTRAHIDMLAQAQASLREADKRKDVFLATLAHELRNPLAPLRTGIAVLKAAPRGGGSIPASRMLEIMERQIDMLVKLIDELLDVARISSGKIELSFEKVNLCDVVDRALESIGAGVRPLTHALTVDLPPYPVWVRGDRSRLVQIVGNLLNNAVKYTPDNGAISLTLRTDGPHACIEVKDSGLGIPKDMLPRVFEMFAQVEGSRSRSQGGLGLGLSLVRSLLTLHGGSVAAHSEGPGQGSTFTVRLPLSLPQEDETLARLPSDGVTAPGLRVLIIDDNADAAEALSLSLLHRVHETRCAYSGAEGLKAAADFVPDVIFCDLGMPGLDGYELARQIRSNRAMDAVKLVALTGWGSEKDRLKACEAGFDHHLTKPASSSAIDSVLRADDARSRGPAVQPKLAAWR